MTAHQKRPSPLIRTPRKTFSNNFCLKLFENITQTYGPVVKHNHFIAIILRKVKHFVIRENDAQHCYSYSQQKIKPLMQATLALIRILVFSR